MVYLWEWFLELGQFSYSEVYHWAALKRIQILPWEVDILHSLHNIRAKVWHDRNR